MRLSRSGFSERSHDGPNWHFLRQQLDSARNVWTTGETPPLPLIVAELAELARYAESSARLPMAEGSRGRQAFVSLRADLSLAIERTGPALRAVCATTLSDLRGALDQRFTRRKEPTRETWASVLQAGNAVAQCFAEHGALSAAMNDLLDVTRDFDGSESIVRFFDRLDTLRVLGELQGRSWSRARQSIARSLSAYEPGDDPSSAYGRFPYGQDLALVTAELCRQLERKGETQEWSVWIAGLAGPSRGSEREPSVVSGAMTVCGVVCQEPLSEWFEQARTSIAQAFEARGLPVPDDVSTIGEPMHVAGHMVADGPSLWGRFAHQPSFVCRVVVSALDVDEAQERARSALDAAISRDDSRVASDLRDDSIVWDRNRGWHLPKITAGGHGHGQLFATRTAVRSVHRWAEDLGHSLDDAAVRLMQDRAVAHDDSTSPAIRIARATVALESLPRPDSHIFNALPNLWLRWALEVSRREFDHLLLGIALDATVVGPPAPDRTIEELLDRQRTLEVLWNDSQIRYGSDGLRALDDLFEVVAPEAASRRWRDRYEALLTSETELGRLHRCFESICERARRHRNLVEHGWPLSAEVLEPSARNLALALEIAVVAHAESDDDDAGFLGALMHPPDEAWNSRSVDDLFRAASHES